MKNTPVLATATRLVAVVSLTTALSGAVLAGGGVTLSVAGGTAHTASYTAAHTATALRVAPAMRCGSDCPWDGSNS